MSSDTDDARWAPVRDWHAAVSGRDLTAAKAVVDPDVRIGGPKGSAQGVEVFLDWVRDSGVRLEPVGWHTVDEHRVVVEYGNLGHCARIRVHTRDGRTTWASP